VYSANELQIEIYANSTSAAGKVPIIFCHGFTLLAHPAAGVAATPDWERFGMIAEITGCPVVAADFGGNTWANPTARGLVGTLRTWLGANIGARTDKFGIAGDSMGSLLAANIAWRDPVACVALWMRSPIVAAQVFHDHVAVVEPGLAASMESAYTNLAGLVAAYPSMDPAVTANRSILASLGSRTRVDYSTDDELISPDVVDQYVADTGALGVVRPGGHSANLYTPPVLVAEWFRDLIRANA
jgi:pimeloyl-ACP methyl ester carboxylesterase